MKLKQQIGSLTTSLSLLLTIVIIYACAGASIHHPTSTQSLSSPAATTVLRHVTVVDVTHGSLMLDMAVEVSGRYIQAISPESTYRPPQNAKSMDLTGRYLIPGFIEMHAHLLLHPWDENGNIMPRYDRGSILKMLRVMLAEGITTVRDPGSPTEAAVTLREMLTAKKVVGPSVLTAGRMLNTGNFNPEPSILIADEKNVRDEIRWQAAAGVDFIKVYSGMPPDLVKVAIDEAHSHGLRVIGHLQRTTWTQASELGIDALTHNGPWSPEYLPEIARPAYKQNLYGRVYWLENVDLDSPAIDSMIDALVRHHVAVDPTLIALHTKFWGNDPRYLQPTQRNLVPELFFKGWSKGSFTASWNAEQYKKAQAQWSKVLSLTKKMFDKGVLLTIGTDTPTPWIIPGISYHEELQLMGDAGIPAPDLLRMATINAAVALGRGNEIGSVKVGMRANLIVLRANPLADIRNTRQIELVVKEGDFFSPQSLLESGN